MLKNIMTIGNKLPKCSCHKPKCFQITCQMAHTKAKILIKITCQYVQTMKFEIVGPTP